MNDKQRDHKLKSRGWNGKMSNRESFSISSDFLYALLKIGFASAGPIMFSEFHNILVRTMNGNS